jgi:hypothetical protein
VGRHDDELSAYDPATGGEREDVGMSDANERDNTDVTEGRTWSNGFTLKKTTSGYSWTISIGLEDQSLLALERAIDDAARLDAKLRKLYASEPVSAKLR